MMVPHGFSASGEPRINDIYENIPLTILRLLEDGWKKSLDHPNMNPDLGEVEITTQFRENMKTVLQEDRWLPLGKEIWILPGTESFSSENISRPDGLIDIGVSFAYIREDNHDHGPHAIIECKRISGGNSGLARQYVVDGICRFRSGKYAGGHKDGFMAGYLLAGEIESAVNSINGYLIRKRHNNEQLRASELIDEPWARSSWHPRAKVKKDIHLHHAFLAFP